LLMIKSGEPMTGNGTRAKAPGRDFAAMNAVLFAPTARCLTI
jgi:hypothetical protein